jgi:hypothetical protein
MALSMRSAAVKPFLTKRTRSAQRGSVRRHVLIRAGGANHVPVGLSSTAILLLLSPSAAHAVADPVAIADLLDSTTVLAGAGVAAIGGLIAVALSKADPAKKSKVVATTAEQAWAALTAEDRAVLVDIRQRGDAKDAGTPDLRPVKKKLLAFPYTQVQPMPMPHAAQPEVAWPPAP